MKGGGTEVAVERLRQSLYPEFVLRCGWIRCEGSKVTPGFESEMQEVTGAGTHFDPHSTEPAPHPHTGDAEEH